MFEREEGELAAQCTRKKQETLVAIAQVKSEGPPIPKFAVRSWRGNGDWVPTVCSRICKLV